MSDLKRALDHIASGLLATCIVGGAILGYLVKDLNIILGIVLGTIVGGTLWRGAQELLKRFGSEGDTTTALTGSSTESEPQPEANADIISAMGATSAQVQVAPDALEDHATPSVTIRVNDPAPDRTYLLALLVRMKKKGELPSKVQRIMDARDFDSVSWDTTPDGSWTRVTFRFDMPPDFDDH